MTAHKRQGCFPGKPYAQPKKRTRGDKRHRTWTGGADHGERHTKRTERYQDSTHAGNSYLRRPPLLVLLPGPGQIISHRRNQPCQKQQITQRTRFNPTGTYELVGTRSFNPNPASERHYTRAGRSVHEQRHGQRLQHVLAGTYKVTGTPCSDRDSHDKPRTRGHRTNGTLSSLLVRERARF